MATPASSAASPNKELGAAIVSYIENTTWEDTETADVAVSCLRGLFKLPDSYKYTGTPLDKLVADVTPATTDFSDVEGMPLFQKYLATVTSKGVFQSFEAGSEPYKRVYAKVVEKFRERLAAKAAKTSASGGAAAPAPASAPAPAPPAPAATAAASLTAEEREEQATLKKGEGNDYMRSGDFARAASCYTAAIDLSPTGPNSHVFYSNRAAARLQMGLYTAAASDAEQAVALAPTYTKAMVRLGSALEKQERYAEAIDQYERALEQEPGNTEIVRRIDAARAKLTSDSVAPSAAPSMGGGGMPDLASMMGGGGGGMPDLASMMGAMGGGGGGGGGGMPGFPAGMDMGAMMNNPMIQNMMNNPQFLQMAQNMMSNPAVQQSVAQMMSGGGSPEGLAGMMGAMGGMPGMPTPAAASSGAAPAAVDGGEGGGSLMDKLSRLGELGVDVEKYKTDPDLAEFWADLEANGPAAAMRHMGNPKLMAMMSEVMTATSGAAPPSAPAPAPAPSP